MFCRDLQILETFALQIKVDFMRYWTFFLFRFEDLQFISISMLNSCRKSFIYKI